MTKRFCDTDIWQKEWFQNFSLKQKIIIKFIFENCDNIGVWEVNYRLASFLIGEEITKKDIDSINAEHFLFEFISDKKVFIPKFIDFQYGKLSENCKPHKSIIDKLKKYNLFERVLKGYSKGINTLEEKEQEQVKEQEKEKDKKENTFFEENIYGEYKNVYLEKADYDKCLALCLDEKYLLELIDEVGEAIEKGKYNTYDSTRPHAHYALVKAFHKHRRLNPNKFQNAPPESPEDRIEKLIQENRSRKEKERLNE